MVESKQEFIDLFTEVFNETELITNEKLEERINWIEQDFIWLKNWIYDDINESLRIYNKEYSKDTFNLKTIEQDKDIQLTLSDITEIDKIIAFINQFENIISYLDTLKKIDKHKYVINLFYFTYFFDFELISWLCGYYSSENTKLLKDIGRQEELEKEENTNESLD